MISERRKHARLRCELYSAVRNLDAEAPDIPRAAVAKDISEGGVRIRVTEFIPLSHRLYFYLSFPNRPPLELTLAPVWISELPHINRFEIGARFLEISPENKKLIQEYQDQILSGK